MAILVLAATIVGLAAVYAFCQAAYNVYFHPLRHFPGPKLNAAFRFPWAVSFWSGRIHQDIKRLHEKYGEAVRIAPEDISFISPEARRDIYSHQSARSFQKDREAYRKPPEGVDNILTANDSDHSRFRKLLSHAFSDRALKEQEELINNTVDLLVERLLERSGQVIDMVQWYNFTTFDLIGDLAFGEPFGCLSSSTYHPWVALLFQSIRAVASLRVLQRYISIQKILFNIPSKGNEKRKAHIALVREKVGQRLELQTTRPDFMKYILRHNDEKGMNRRELEANANLLILAGSETTATALSGATYYLLRNPESMRKLVKEIRSQFQTAGDMTTEKLANCTYLNNVLQEALRVYPPVPVGLPRRVVSDGAVVAGYPVPKGTVVSLSNWGANGSAGNFRDADSFIPERWSRSGFQEVESEAGDKYSSDRREVFEPFSIGPRNCIGKNLAWIEMRLILARVLFEFDLTLLDDNWNPAKQETYLLWQKPALNIRCEIRKNWANEVEKQRE